MTVKELLTPSSNWTKGAMAKSRIGYVVPFYSRSAISWCLMGAIKYCYRAESDRIRVCGLVRDKLESMGLDRSITTYNDTHTYEEVMSIVDELGI